MPGPAKFVALLLLLCLAAGLNLWFTEWGTNLEGAPILTVQLDPEYPWSTGMSPGFGLYSPVSLGSAPWISMGFGVLGPLVCFGVMAYILVRVDPKTTGS